MKRKRPEEEFEDELDEDELDEDEDFEDDEDFEEDEDELDDDELDEDELDEDELDEDERIDAIVGRIAEQVVQMLAGDEDEDFEDDDEDDNLEPRDRILLAMAERLQDQDYAEVIQTALPNASKTQIRNFLQSFRDNDVLGTIQAIIDANEQEEEVRTQTRKRRAVRKKQSGSTRNRSNRRDVLRPQEAVRASIKDLLGG